MRNSERWSNYQLYNLSLVTRRVTLGSFNNLLLCEILQIYVQEEPRRQIAQCPRPPK